MIVARQKPIEEVLEFVQGYEKILIAGCNECVTVCEAGGQKEVGLLGAALRLYFLNRGRSVQVSEVMAERQCEAEFVLPLEDLVRSHDAVLSLACGAGVQFLAERFMGVPILPGVDTVFMGVTEERGVWSERCQGCGQCVLASTGGICPVARCSKRMLNGPCGGSTGGHCEINKEIDCGWQLIIDRLKNLGQLQRYEAIAPIKDWSRERSGGPRKVFTKDWSE
jgi:ferredoxin